MKILAIETSCDDTGVAIIEASKTGFKVLSNIISSQIEIHKQYGGVFPALAKREHQKNLVNVCEQALKEANLLIKKTSEEIPDLKDILSRETELEKHLAPFLQKYQKPDVDFISVTNGPGLEPCLWVGVNFAKALSNIWNIPVIPVNHIESHILVNILEKPEIKFPAIALVVSGGHTQIILVKKIGSYKILGETKDDAAGECFDKCSQLLGLGYPGGPIISKLASEISECKIVKRLPRPMFATEDYDFSFSGLKTAVLYADKEVKNKNEQYKKEMAYQIQQAIVDVLVKKTMKAVRISKAKSLILGGGVSANQELRKQFKEKLEKDSPKTEFIVPSPTLSTDNAVMTAISGFYHKKNTVKWEKISADGNLRIQ